MALIESLLSLLSVIVSSFGGLLLASLGLAVIFGMMGIINMAHGEFIMLGAYGTAIASERGLPLVLAMLVGGLVAAIAGLIIERLVVRHLYDRPIDSMVATWGISIILIKVMLVVFGSSYSGVSTPFGALRYGSFSASMYRFVLAAAAVGLLVVTYYVFMNTEFGLHARATIQDAETAKSMGIDTSRVYAVTFVFGSALAGLAGGLFAPIATISPNLGSTYIIEAFVTVIVGGTNVLLGTPASAGILSVINGGGSHMGGTLLGRVLLLVAAVVMIRVQPRGLSSYFTNR
ncbi:ABC transporter permease subunit [Halobellus sp. GM3]|uniref:ABC transporter permease subunit n=1 Tax=Halobellus sp. GM3 TaxID=3458410 RepID=UPI00403E09AE